MGHLRTFWGIFWELEIIFIFLLKKYSIEEKRVGAILAAISHSNHKMDI